MAGDLILRKLTNLDRSFYPTMGPFLARREIAKEVGGHIWDDDNKRWYVAVEGRKVAGFAAARDGSARVTFQSAYTLPDYRRRGVYADAAAGPPRRLRGPVLYVGVRGGRSAGAARQRGRGSPAEGFVHGGAACRLT